MNEKVGDKEWESEIERNGDRERDKKTKTEEKTKSDSDSQRNLTWIYAKFKQNNKKQFDLQVKKKIKYEDEHKQSFEKRKHC